MNRLALLIMATACSLAGAATSRDHMTSRALVTSAASVVSPGASVRMAPGGADRISTVRPLRGVNLSGGEFGRVPGQLNKNYVYPSVAEVDFFAKQGFGLIRVPFRWERLQPVLGGPLAETDRAALHKLTTYATDRRLVVVLDLHDYASRQIDGKSQRLGSSPSFGADQLADMWAKLAADYRGNDRVWIGLMNEPNGISAERWWQVAQATVSILRKRGVTNRIMIPGTSWTGAHSWLRNGNAAQAARFVDPAGNSAFDVHQYLDRDSSGTKPECVAGAAGRIDAVIGWARERRVALFLGEIAAGNTPQCETEYRAILSSVERSGVFIGWAAWGAGSWWTPSYPFRLTPVGWPKATEPTPHFRQLQQFMRRDSRSPPK